MYIMSKTWCPPIGKLSRSSRERGQINNRFERRLSAHKSFFKSLISNQWKEKVLSFTGAFMKG